MDGTSTQLDDELATILDALFRCTKVDLQIEDAQAGSPLSCADGGSPDFNRRSASEHPDDTSVGACEEEQRGSILQGEDLALLLTLKPVRGSLETEMSNAFGLCGPEDLQLECWNRLTACLFVSAQLVPCGPEYADDDLVVVKGRCCVGAPAADVPAACSRGLPQRLQPLQMAAVSTQGDCCPSVYRLGLKVEGQLTCAVSTRHFVRVEVELGSLTQLRRVFADMSDAAAGFSALCAEEQSMDVALAVTNLCCPPSDTDTDVLQQLSYNEFSSYGMLSSGSALMTLLKPTTVINPLKVEVRVTEPLPRYNCVQVSVSNPLTRTVRVQDLCVHLPTTTSVDDAADGSSPCIFSAKSGKDEASFRPHGFDAACRVECFMVGTETEVCVMRSAAF